MTYVTTHLSTAIECCNCHVLFAMTDEMLAARRADHKQFYCPNGHPQSYQGKTAEQKLAEAQRLLETERKARQRADARATEANRRLEQEAEARRAAVAKGNRTKAQKRAAALDAKPPDGLSPQVDQDRAVRSASTTTEGAP